MSMCRVKSQNTGSPSCPALLVVVGQALLNSKVFGTACQPNKRQLENYIYQQQKKVYKAVNYWCTNLDSDNYVDLFKNVKKLM
ncbi:hypothetical protein DPMN_081059 [Dreissena polymorpha]|uniref:Uncharacterized protein n=1 Tax=Dreissena polymorpha TaxID=45954 RepID=A0A9D3Y5D1_DREPO|nr:hypothetical protein DPMN_081059 [Dreissena polymorpha]